MAALLASLSASSATASDDSVTRLSLRGVKALDVVVEAISENDSGLTQDDLQTDVELRCRQAGIKLEKVTTPYLYINVIPQEVRYADGRLNAYAVFVEVKFVQVVLLERAPAMRMAAPTWSVGRRRHGPPMGCARPRPGGGRATRALGASTAPATGSKGAGPSVLGRRGVGGSPRNVVCRRGRRATTRTHSCGRASLRLA